MVISTTKRRQITRQSITEQKDEEIEDFIPN